MTCNLIHWVLGIQKLKSQLAHYRRDKFFSFSTLPSGTVTFTRAFLAIARAKAELHFRVNIELIGILSRSFVMTLLLCCSTQISTSSRALAQALAKATSKCIRYQIQVKLPRLHFLPSLGDLSMPRAIQRSWNPWRTLILMFNWKCFRILLKLLLVLPIWS